MKYFERTEGIEMIELFSTLTISQLLIFIVMIMLAAKELITILEFFWKKIRSIFDKEYEIKDEKKEILDRLDELSEQISQQREESQQFSTQLEELRQEYRNVCQKQQKTLDSLIASDIEDIKSDIVKQYHRFIEKQWIDDFSMDAIERRFARYQEEGGNSYVHTLVEKLRQLPNEPPT